MKLYSCKVRIMGQVQDEVVKTGVSNAEILVLRTIHGSDAVLDIAEIVAPEKLEEGETAPATDNGNDEAAERDQLEMTYGEGIISKIFGAPQARISDEPAAPRRPLATKPNAPRKAASIVELEDV